MPAESWSPASEGPTVSTVGFRSKLIGSAPNFRLVERLLASDSLKLPLIWAPPLIRWDAVGAEMTTPSSTMANC